jgi:hypothetical protein
MAASQERIIPTGRRLARLSACVHGRAGRWLARAIWISLVAATLVVFFGVLPDYLDQLRTICLDAACNYQQLTAGQLQTLNVLGWSLDQYANLQIALYLVSISVSLVVSALIVWRRPGDWMAMLVAFSLVLTSPVLETANIAEGPDYWLVASDILVILTSILLWMVWLLFPSGRPVPSWMRWILPVSGGGLILFIFVLPDTRLVPASTETELGWLITIGTLAALTPAQVYRYRRFSTPLERQQTKWGLLGYGVPIVVSVVLTLLGFVPAFIVTDSVLSLAANESGFLLTIVPPLAFGVAILRYHLWEVDTIINLALVYGLLTGILGAVYIGLILGLQQVVGRLTGQSTHPAVLIISTLAIAGLVLPLRRRLQAIINRRLYRTKYDAEKTLAAFSETLRHQVDVEHLHDQVLAVVAETMQPAQAWLWLRPQSDSSEPSLYLLDGPRQSSGSVE